MESGRGEETRSRSASRHRKSLVTAFEGLANLHQGDCGRSSSRSRSADNWRSS